MLNRVALMGRHTAEPELKHTPTGVPVTSFTLACNRSYVTQGGTRETDFIDCVAWRGTAEFICRYFKKGQMIAVDGRIETRSYEDKNGNKRKVFEIVVDSAHFCESKKEQSPTFQPVNTAPAEAPMFFESGEFEEITDDDMPF